MSEELEYEINQRVTELAREMHEKEKSEFEQLQVQLERIDCKKVLSLGELFRGLRKFGELWNFEGLSGGLSNEDSCFKNFNFLAM